MLVSLSLHLKVPWRKLSHRFSCVVFRLSIYTSQTQADTCPSWEQVIWQERYMCVNIMLCALKDTLPVCIHIRYWLQEADCCVGLILKYLPTCAFHVLITTHEWQGTGYYYRIFESCFSLFNNNNNNINK